MNHNITSARYESPAPPGGYPADAPVIAVRNGIEEYRRANDDIDGGGMLSYIAGGGTISAYVAPAKTKSDVDAEWSRRVFSEFAFEGETYHADRDSIANVAGAAIWAQDAIANGVSAGNFYWQAANPANPSQSDLPFAWKSKSNGLIQMDAPTVIAFAKALATWKQSHFLAARAIKEMTPIPADYDADSRWP